MFAFVPVFLALASSATALPQAVDKGGITPPGASPARTEYARAGESHKVTLVNRCGGGSAAKFLYRDNGAPQGSTTIDGPLYGGVAWVEGLGDTNCGSSGLNCGTVEFSLINTGTDAYNTDNSINYSLQTQGNHLFKYPMHFAYEGGGSCAGKAAPGTCASANDCPGAFVGTDTASGTPANCLGDNAGIVITFC